MEAVDAGAVAGLRFRRGGHRRDAAGRRERRLGTVGGDAFLGRRAAGLSLPHAGFLRRAAGDRGGHTCLQPAGRLAHIGPHLRAHGNRRHDRACGDRRLLWLGAAALPQGRGIPPGPVAARCPALDAGPGGDTGRVTSPAGRSGGCHTHVAGDRGVTGRGVGGSSLLRRARRPPADAVSPRHAPAGRDHRRARTHRRRAGVRVHHGPRDQAAHAVRRLATTCLCRDTATDRLRAVGDPARGQFRPGARRRRTHATDTDDGVRCAAAAAIHVDARRAAHRAHAARVYPRRHRAGT